MQSIEKKSLGEENIVNGAVQDLNKSDQTVRKSCCDSIRKASDKISSVIVQPQRQ